MNFVQDLSLVQSTVRTVLTQYLEHSKNSSNSWVRCHAAFQSAFGHSSSSDHWPSQQTVTFIKQSPGVSYSPNFHSDFQHSKLSKMWFYWLMKLVRACQKAVICSAHAGVLQPPLSSLPLYRAAADFQPFIPSLFFSPSFFFSPSCPLTVQTRVEA